MLAHPTDDPDDLDGENQEKNLLGTQGSSPAVSAADVVTAVPLDVSACLEASNEIEHGNGGVAATAGDGANAKPEYKDTPFLVAFVLHMIFVLGVALFAGIPALSAAAPTNATASSSSSSSSSSGHMASLLTPIWVACIVAPPLSFFALRLIQNHTMYAIKGIMVCVLAIKCALALYFFASGLIFAGVVTLLLAAATLCFFYFARRRLAFAAAHLELACDAIRGHPMTVYVAFSTQVVQLIWMLIWVLGLYGILGGGKDGYTSSSTGTFIAITGWVFFLYWFCYTAQNVAHCTTSGVVGSWWFTTQPTKTVGRSLSRALTTSFGSIAFGSLIVALIQTARFVLRSLERSLRRSDNSIAAFVVCCARCLVRMVEGWVRYFNKYAFVVVSLYGKGFRESGSEVWSLFNTRGWTAIINDDLVEMVLRFTALGIAVITAFFGGLVALSQSPSVEHPPYMPVFVSFFIGLFLASTILGVIDSAVKTIFVCYAKAPAALHATHPNSFFRINSAWGEFHPDKYEKCGYREMAVAYGQPVVHATPTMQATAQPVPYSDVTGFQEGKHQQPPPSAPQVPPATSV